MDRFTAQLIAFNNFLRSSVLTVDYIHSCNVKHDEETGLWKVNYIVHYDDNWSHESDVIDDSENSENLFYLEQSECAIHLI